ncbi:hypothetical protein [Anaerotignum sp.]
MLIYMILMLGIAIFFYQESKKLLKGQSNLFQEFCTDPVSTKKALSLLRKVFLTSLVSAVLMFLCFLMTKATGSMPKPVAALSILCYGIGFIAAMFQLKNF